MADRTGASAIIGARDGHLQVEKTDRCRGFGYGRRTLDRAEQDGRRSCRYLTEFRQARVLFHVVLDDRNRVAFFQWEAANPNPAHATRTTLPEIFRTTTK